MSRKGANRERIRRPRPLPSTSNRTPNPCGSLTIHTGSSCPDCGGQFLSWLPPPAGSLTSLHPPHTTTTSASTWVQSCHSPAPNLQHLPVPWVVPYELFSADHFHPPSPPVRYMASLLIHVGLPATPSSPHTNCPFLLLTKSYSPCTDSLESFCLETFPKPRAQAVPSSLVS